MSTAVSCQDLNFVGGQRYGGSCSIATSPDSVDVSRETLLSFWSAAPLDNIACQHEPPQQDTIQVLNYVTEPDPLWTDSLSPHLLRNKQLQDILLQREEELARLHDENNKLKEFLNSSFVKCLEEKTKLLLSGELCRGKKSQKRTCRDEGRWCPRQRQGKRTCQNLSLEFCSTEEQAAAPPASSCVFQTLGLRDQDSIDPPKSNNAGSDLCLYRSAAVSPSHHYNSRCDADPSTYYSCPDNHCPAYSSNINSLPHASVTNHETLQTPLPSFPLNSDSLENYDFMSTALPEVRTTNCLNSKNTPQTHCAPLGGNITPCSSLCSPHGRTDLAFSMSLNRSSSVRTHSFPQGQAFVRRDMHGGWSFTWIPKHAR